MSEALKTGYTSGTCAALAASAAATLLLGRQIPDLVSVLTPSGQKITVSPEHPYLEGSTARCAVRKDAGDDPDVTDGILIYASVRKIPHGILIDGGEGIGRVTKPGLDQPVGAAAINHVPRQMIRDATLSVCEIYGYCGGLEIVISVPGGAEIAKKTMNPSLGIEGGISILGTSGIVYPMSDQAIIDTIAVEAHQLSVLYGTDRLILVPGNHGMEFLTVSLPFLADIPRLKCSNFIGDSLDIARKEGFQAVLLIGHIGKLIKLAGGILNTHSKNADCRKELFCAHAALCGADVTVCRALMQQVTSEACLDILDSAGLREPVIQSLLTAIQEVLQRHMDTDIPTGAIIFSNRKGLLGMTDKATRLLQRWH